MFYIKSDNIEELFREAAEKYHIDTADAEAWDDVKAAVHADDVPPQPPPPEKKRKRRWFVFAWLLLIPLGWFAHNAWNALNGPGQKTSDEKIAKAPQTVKTNRILDSKTNKTVTEKTIVKDASENKHLAVATTPKDKSENKNEKPLVNNYGSKLLVKQGSSFMHLKQAGIAASDSFSTRPGINPPGPGIISNGKQGNTPPAENIATLSNDQVAGALQKDADTDKKADTVKNQAVQENTSAGNTAKQPANADNTKSDNTSDKKQKVKVNGDHYFYAGLSISPDVSFIHFQKTSALGIGAGVLLGYHINNKLSIETGLMYDKKNYYTAGKYFDKSKLPYGRNIKLLEVEGNCKMVEIPLNLRYTFNAKTKNKFYALAGLSSYIMGSQYYNYDYTWMSNYYKKSFSSNKVSTYMFSVLNIGAGYERTLGSKTSIRIEPYMKLPLAGLGTGSLKIASTGLYFSLTRKIP